MPWDLDIRLNQLTNGEKDLLSVVQKLMKTYGKDKPFDDATFIDAFVAASHPDIRQFFDDYVIGKNLLPYDEYFASIGWDHQCRHTRRRTVWLATSDRCHARHRSGVN